MEWHSRLEPGDVQTAHQLLTQHVPQVDGQGVSRCANADHSDWAAIPVWPCDSARWSYEILAANESAATPEVA